MCCFRNFPYIDPNLVLVPNPLHKTFTERFVEPQKLKPRLLTLSSEFVQICKAVAVGFAVMGFIGYFVKLIHIPMYVASYFPLVLC